MYVLAGPKGGPWFFYLLLKAGGCHPLFMAAGMALMTKALALWAGSSVMGWEGRRGWGRVFQARSKTEPPNDFLLAGGLSWVPYENYIKCISQLGPTL